MKINIQQDDNYTTIGLDGAVDLSSSSDARKNIIEVLKENKNIISFLILLYIHLLSCFFIAHWPHFIDYNWRKNVQS